MWHDFPASHHYSGPHDNAGKTPRIRMQNDTKFDRVRQTTTINLLLFCPHMCLSLSQVGIYNYHQCFEYCRKYMSKPSKKQEDVRGTWGCNGRHFWLAFSNGIDLYKDKYDVVPNPKQFDVTALPGSNELYCFRGTNTADGTSTSLKHKFMQCYCAECRADRYASCPSRDEFGCWGGTVIQKKAANARRRTRQEYDEPCQHCGTTDDGGDDPTR
jgi:hypothetical protein